MKNPNFIQKGLSWVVVLSIVAVHMCSFTCAMGVYSCVDDLKVAKGSNSHSCCSDKNNKEERNNNCQEEHLTFFHTFGKSPVSKVEQAAKIFPPLIAELLPLSFHLWAQPVHPSVDYVIFHPPPPSGGMQILTSSFLI